MVGQEAVLALQARVPELLSPAVVALTQSQIHVREKKKRERERKQENMYDSLLIVTFKK